MAASHIRVLNDQTINKIAAGEVIENPASVVKELVENSLDAGATAIVVEIKEGGRQLIRISDNGCGMSSDDAILCLERHATSKIREVEDIEALLTMGFRGEAIPSIAAISKFTLLTSPRSEGEKKEEGTYLIVEGGKLLTCSSAVRSQGTTIEVKSLFFNVPVRRKFQKSPTFDSQDILKTVGFLALAHPTVEFELISDAKTLLKTPLSLSSLSFHELLGRRMECVLGKEYASSLIPLKFERGAYKLTGYIGSPSAHKPNKTGQHLFINQRLVSSPLVSSTVREGYGTMLPGHRYPLFVLHLHLPGDLLDVNVHPQKKEVRLRQETDLKEMIIQGVQTALRQDKRHLPAISIEEEISIPPVWAPYGSPFAQHGRSGAVEEEKWAFKSIAPSAPVDVVEKKIESVATINPLASPLFCPSSVKIQRRSSDQTSTLGLLPNAPRVLMTLVGYCIIEPSQLQSQLIGVSAAKREGGLLILDQRAAYSRVYYEKLLKRSGGQEAQHLLIPLTLQLSAVEFQAMSQYAPLLNQMGFGVREFGQDAFLVDACPSFLKAEQLQGCLHELIQDLVEVQSSRRVQIHKEEQLALAACRASLPSAKQLSLDEAQGLIAQLLACDLSSQCPMGKPTCLYFSPEELAKWFQK